MQKYVTSEKMLKIKIIKKSEIMFHYTGKYRGAAHSIYNLKFYAPNEILVVLHNGSNYDYHFIIKELANEFEGQFECLGEKKTRLFPSH